MLTKKKLLLQGVTGPGFKFHSQIRVLNCHIQWNMKEIIHQSLFVFDELNAVDSGIWHSY